MNKSSASRLKGNPTSRKMVIHEVLIKGLSHAIKHKSTGTLETVLANLPDGRTKERVKLWILAYAPVLVADAPEFRLKIDKEKLVDLEAAKGNPYWTMVLPIDDARPTSSGIKQDLLKEMNTFLKDPSDQNQDTVIRVMETYQRYARSPVKASLEHKPNNLVAGGAPGLKG